MVKKTRKTKQKFPPITQLEICRENSNGELMAKTINKKDNLERVEIFVLPNL